MFRPLRLKCLQLYRQSQPSAADLTSISTYFDSTYLMPSEHVYSSPVVGRSCLESREEDNVGPREISRPHHRCLRCHYLHSRCRYLHDKGHSICVDVNFSPPSCKHSQARELLFLLARLAVMMIPLTQDGIIRCKAKPTEFIPASCRRAAWRMMMAQISFDKRLMNPLTSHMVTSCCAKAVRVQRFQ